MKSISRLLYLLITIILIIFSFSILYKFVATKYKNKNAINQDVINEIPYLNIKNEPKNLDNEESKTIKIYNDLSSAVVNITYYKTEYVRYFFDLYPQTSEGQGSGAFIDPRGYIITNYHVIGDADKVTVTLTQGEGIYDAKIIGVDPENDLAVIKISTSKKKFNTIPLGTSKNLSVGQKVYAIGNPFGLDRTLTTGIISGLGRPIKTKEGSVIEGAIQTDASINPGNSGGPLIDSSGKLIGINTMIISPSGGSVGLGFAIPVDTVKEVAEEIIKYGYVKRGWIDATFLPINQYIAQELGYSVDYGVMVMMVAKNGEAYKAGLRGGKDKALYRNKIVYIGGEVIVAIDSIKIKDYSSLVQVLKDKKPGDIVNVEYYIKNKKHTTKIKLINKRKFISN
jgi:S1-C subfamily serine protease